MTTPAKLAAGSVFPSLSFTTVDGKSLDVARMPGWRMLVVYRGKHCPRCKRYLKTLDGMLDDFKTAGVTVITVSADTKEKAEVDIASEGWRFPVACGLTLEQMRTLGVYISEPRSPEETDRPFSEPGLFVINPGGRVQVIDISNAPFARPDLATVLAGIKFTQDKSLPVRGTLT